ncbi:MAG: hypothetical protein M9932_04385 [Xanthobacteraceae bacterium]|nr:hypothetical protein [Xanthobacteraceae bacterium]
MTQLSPTALEAAAKAIAEHNGDDIDTVPTSKSHWNAEAGHFGGRFRTVNEPFRSDYEEQATAAITAYLEARRTEGFVEVPVEPTVEMTEAALHCHAVNSPFESPFGPGGSFASYYRVMIAAAQNGGVSDDLG